MDGTELTTEPRTPVDGSRGIRETADAGVIFGTIGPGSRWPLDPPCMPTIVKPASQPGRIRLGYRTQRGKPRLRATLAPTVVYASDDARAVAWSRGPCRTEPTP